jgi:hypothetical protein
MPIEIDKRREKSLFRPWIVVCIEYRGRLLSFPPIPLEMIAFPTARNEIPWQNRKLWEEALGNKVIEGFPLT